MLTEERLGPEDRAELLRLLAVAREAIEMAAPYLPRDSDADLAAARALAGIYRLDGTVRSGGPAGDQG